MDRINITDIKIEDYPKIKSNHYESEIYIYGDSLAKIVDPIYREGRESILIDLDLYKIPGTVLPTKLLTFTNYKGENRFCGYLMKNHSDYESLCRLYYMGLSFEEKKSFIIKINEIYRNIFSKDMNYWDVTENNIMTNGEDILFCDMDSVHRLNDVNLQDIETKQKLFMISLSILLGMSARKVPRKLGLKSINRFINTITQNNELRTILTNIYADYSSKQYNRLNYSEFMRIGINNGKYFFDEAFDEFTEDGINEGLRLIKK